MAWSIDGITCHSRLMLGTANYPNLETLSQSIQASGTQIITVSLRREVNQQGQQAPFWDYIKEIDGHILPNTAGCRNAKEAITTAHMAREVFGTHWIKLEVVGEDYHLQPDALALIEATHVLIQEGFFVFPYCTDDLVICQRLVDMGCQVLMPWGAPIGSGQGLLNPFALRSLRNRLPQIQLIVDAGIGAPSHAAQAMEMGFDAVLLNSAVSLSAHPVTMAQAFGQAIIAGRLAYEAGIMPKRDFAVASTPIIGQPFWHHQKDASNDSR